MKPKEFVKEFTLTDNKPLKTVFWDRFKIEFMTVLDHEQGLESLSRFEHAVDIMKDKWRGIKLKSGNVNVNEKAWGFFFASVVAPMREELFPNEVQRMKEEAAARKEQKQRYRSKRSGDFLENAFKHIMEERIKRFEELRKKLQETMAVSVVLTTSKKVLGIPAGTTIDKENVKTAYRKLALSAHPDAGGSAALFRTLTNARDYLLKYLAKRETEKITEE